MTDFREEAYILEKMEITEDDDDDNFQYEEIKDDDLDLAKESEDEEDDLNNFEALKAKTTYKMTAREGETTRGGYKAEPKPKVVERDVVIDDFIRNFLQKMNMGKTLNVF